MASPTMAPPSTQPQPQPSPAAAAPLAISLPQASHLLVAFTDFLTVAIHNILFYRGLYPPATFLTARAYNLAVHQSRHPRVCAWVRDAVDAVKAQLVRGAVSRIAVVIHHHPSTPPPQPPPPQPPPPPSRSPSDSSRDRQEASGSSSKMAPAVLERWMFDVAAFPAFAGVRDPPRGSSRRDAEDDGLGAPPADDAREGEDAGRQGWRQQQQQQQRDGTGMVNWTDVDEAFRGAVRRMALAGERLGPLPEGCSFTVAVELRDEGEAPIGYPQDWIPSEPNLQTRSQGRPEAGKDVGGAKAMPVRTVEAGPLFFECWIEEGKAKEDLVMASNSAT